MICAQGLQNCYFESMEICADFRKSVEIAQLLCYTFQKASAAGLFKFLSALRRFMLRTVKQCTSRYKQSALELVQQVFTDYGGAEEGELTRRLVEEIRSKKYFVPELELVATDERDRVIGYAMFSRFHLEGKFDDRLLLLSPVAVLTEMQRQHISKDLIEHGFEVAKKLGYKAVLVEGNPQNYRSRGFVTSALFGIVASPSVGLPAQECLMVKELVPNGLQGICGMLDYGYYSALR